MEKTAKKRKPTRDEIRRSYYGKDDEALRKTGLRLEITDKVLVMKDGDGNCLMECPLREMFNRKWMRFHFGMLEARKMLRLMKEASKRVVIKNRRETDF